MNNSPSVLLMNKTNLQQVVKRSWLLAKIAAYGVLD